MATAYQPSSYDDAAALRTVLSAALDAEITAAGGAGDDAAYGALKTLRSAVVRDLTARGASLPSVVIVVFGQPMPALAIAQRLYRDASRADEIVVEAGAPHPAFCPVSFQVLTSGLGANLGAAIPAVTEPDAGAVAIRPGTVSGPYHAPPPPPLPPGAPVGLTIIDAATTRTSVSLTWTAPGTAGDPPDSYTVQVGAVDPATGVADSFVSAVTVAAPLTTAIVGGLAPSTVYDFQVFASNENGQGAVSGIVATSTHANAPHAPTGLGASAGTPAETVMVLTWTASAVDASHDAAASYAVYYRPTGTSSFLAATPDWAAGASATVTGLAAGTSYDFEVVANNWGGAAVSTVVTATTFARVPNVPTGLAAGTLLAVTKSSTAVSWVTSVVDGAHDTPASYTLQYRVTGGGAWTQISGITGTMQTVTGLSAGTSYDFQVEAVNAGGASGFTATANGTTYAVTIALNYVSPSPFAHDRALARPGAEIGRQQCHRSATGGLGVRAQARPRPGRRDHLRLLARHRLACGAGCQRLLLMGGALFYPAWRGRGSFCATVMT